MVKTVQDKNYGKVYAIMERFAYNGEPVKWHKRYASPALGEVVETLRHYYRVY